MWLVASPLLLVALGVGALMFWATRPGPGEGRLVTVSIPVASALEVSQVLADHGLVKRPWLFATYLSLSKWRVELEGGEHLLLDSLSPRDLVGQLARLKSRATTRVTLIEGWTHRDVARRLEAKGICTEAAFVAAVRDSDMLARLGLDADSAEGYLFPDTYDLHHDTSAETVLVTLVQSAKRQLGRLRAAHPAHFERLKELFGFSEREWVTLASILEKEAVDGEELPTIASVFFNRLTDPSFRPERMLQSDPTAAYGCLVEPERAASCEGFQGKIVPEMLRDSDNRYNTYRHPGLPPGPISNPGKAALLAVLQPAETDYLFFFADGKGRHTFTRTFDEHRESIRQRQRK